MGSLIKPGDLMPAAAVKDFARRFADTIESVPESVAATFTLIDSNAAARLWRFSHLLEIWNYPDPRWCGEALLELGTWGTPQQEIQHAARSVPFPRDTPTFIVGEWADQGLASTWGFYLDHLFALQSDTVAAPFDGAWVAANFSGEFTHIHRTTFSRVREITLASNFPRPDGVAVPKPQYIVRFDDGSHWLSGDLRRENRRAWDEVFEFIANAANVPIHSIPVLPEELARKPRPAPE